MEKGLPFPGITSITEFTRNYLSYGSIFFERGYMTEAEHFLQLALRDDPNNSEALYGLGSIHLQQKNRPKRARHSNASSNFHSVILARCRTHGTTSVCCPPRRQHRRSDPAI